ncbi:hypothetical protein [Cellvibrio mixtus]|uniref:hypothetical protein n=1 Tax=Cellvibrio mixtus TaxID=39650 RepID=UPI001269AF40|nr:hypothetical protein [Cellvibrio mixtus]
MRVIKMLGAALLGLAVLINVGANAQGVPVSCTWSVASSEGPPNGTWRDVVRVCKEANNTWVASQNFRSYNGSNVMENCTLTLAANISSTGACSSPSFFRTAVSSSSASSSASPVCPNAGKFLGQGCANGTANIPVPTLCGNNCSLRFETIGWTTACPYAGEGRSPEVKVFCQ